MFGGTFDIFIIIEVLINIFDNHDTVGHQHPHRTAQTEQGHNVERIFEPRHGSKGHHHGNRHGNHNNEGTAHVVQKEEEQHRGQQDPHKNRAFGIIHRCLNKFAGVLEPHQFHTRGQFAVLLDAFHPFADAFNNLNGVGFRLFHHVEAGGGLAVHKCFGADFAAHQFYFGNVAHIDALVFDRTDFQRKDLFKVFVVAGKGDVLFSFIHLNTAQRLAHVVGFELVYDRRHRNIHRVEFGAVKQNMDLHFVGTVNTHFTHAGDRSEFVGDNVISVVVQIFLSTVTDQKDLHHGGGVGVDLADSRLFGAVRQIVTDSVQCFTDVGCGNIHVGTHIEFQRNIGLVLDRHTGNTFDTIQRRNRIFDLADDFRFDFRGAGTLIFAAHQNGGNFNIGQQVDTQTRVESRPDHNQYDDKCRHCNRTAHACFA